MNSYMLRPVKAAKLVYTRELVRTLRWREKSYSPVENAACSPSLITALTRFWFRIMTVFIVTELQLRNWRTQNASFSIAQWQNFDNIDIWQVQDKSIAKLFCTDRYGAPYQTILIKSRFMLTEAVSKLPEFCNIANTKRAAGKMV
jgi:hypothetical protein